MLQTQVNYWTLMENRRHNLASEGENQRHNVRTEDLGFDTLVETRRHNVVSEDLGFRTLDETRRHNVQTESIGWGNLAETTRHNKATEDIGWADIGIKRQNAETNAFSAQEMQRHNIMSENIGQLQAAASQQQAAASSQQAAAANKQAANTAARLDFDRSSYVNDYQKWYQDVLPLEKRKQDTAEYEAETRRIQAETGKQKSYGETFKNIGQGVMSIIPLIP